MGKIPEYRSAPIESTAQTARIGQAADLGDSIARAAYSVQETFQRRDEARDMSFVSSRMIDLETKANQHMANWQRDHAGDPVGKEEALQQSIQQEIETIGGSAPSERARASLQRMGNDVKRRLSVEGNDWANKQVVKNIGNEIDRSSQTLQTEAFRTADPNKLQDLYKQHDMLLVTAQSSLSSEAVKNIDQVGKREITANLVQGMIENDRLSDAQRFLDSKKYDQILGADNTRKAYEMIDRKREMFANRQEKLENLKYNQPWKYVQEIGETNGLPPVQMEGNPKAITDSFLKRESFVSDMNKKHGIQLPFLADREVDFLADSFMQKNPGQAAELMSNLDDKTSDRQKALIGRQLFAKEPGLAAAMMIAGQDKSAASGIVKGMSLMRKGPGESGKPVEVPSDANIDTDFDSYVGAAVDDTNARMAIRNAAAALMVNNLYGKGKSTKEYAQSDLRDALKTIMGPVASINGQKTASFRGKDGKFLDEDRLEDLVEGLRDSDVEKVQGDVPRTASGEPINLKKANGRIKLKAIGEGTYWLMTEEGIALDKNKQPFRLNLKEIEKTKVAKSGPSFGQRLENAFGVK